MAATYINQAKKILKKQYNRVFVCEKDGKVSAAILEFVGCYTYGNNLSEAAKYLQAAAEGWVAAGLQMGQEIPKPLSADQVYYLQRAVELPKIRSALRSKTWKQKIFGA